MLDACPTNQSDGGEFSQLFHILSLIGLIEKISMLLMESHLRSNILLQFKFYLQKRKFDYRNL